MKKGGLMYAFLVVEKEDKTIKNINLFNTQTFAKLFVDESFNKAYETATPKEQKTAKQYKDTPHFKITGKNGTVYQTMACPIEIEDEKENINPVIEDRKAFLIYEDNDEFFYARATADPNKAKEYKEKAKEDGVNPEIKEMVLLDLTVGM